MIKKISLLISLFFCFTASGQVGIMHIIGFGMGDLDHELSAYSGNTTITSQPGTNYPTYFINMQGVNATPGQGSFSATATDGNTDNGDKYIMGFHGFFDNTAHTVGNWDMIDIEGVGIIRKEDGTNVWTFVSSDATDYDIDMTALSNTSGQYMELIYDFLASGDIQIYLDGTLVLNETGVDLGGVAFGDIILNSSQQNDDDFGLYSYYFLSGATDSTDIATYHQTTIGWDVITYANADPADWNGDAFDNGTVADCQTIPANPATEAEYTGTPMFGNTICDDNSPNDRSGPDNDVDILDTESIYGLVTRGRYTHNGGGATTHYVSYGNDRSGGTSVAITLLASYSLKSLIWTSTVYIPFSTDYLRHGFGIIGAQDIKSSGFCTEILHRSPARRIMIH